jgi:hypothetical protein
VLFLILIDIFGENGDKIRKKPMNRKSRLFIFLFAAALISLSCKYVVVPDDLIQRQADHGAWGAVVTQIDLSAEGDLRMDVTIRNETGDWSTMQAVPQKSAILKNGSASINCETVQIGTGGHRLAPGLQMRGYTTGSKSDPVTQLLFIECKGITGVEPGATVSFDYNAFNGELDYYHQDANKSVGTIQMSLDEVEEGLVYPIFLEIEGLVKPQTADIPAISNNRVNLVNVQRTDEGFVFDWKNSNPTNFALTTHIGTPPVIGEDGIIYGIFQIMDIAPVPMTPAVGEVEWSTEVSVPAGIHGFYILMSVEDKQMRLYVNHLIDITDK